MLAIHAIIFSPNFNHFFWIMNLPVKLFLYYLKNQDSM